MPGLPGQHTRPLAFESEAVEFNGLHLKQDDITMGPIVDALIELCERGWSSFWVESLCVDLSDEKERRILHQLKSAHLFSS